MHLFLLKILMLEESSNSLRLINFGICLMIQGGWFEEVCFWQLHKNVESDIEQVLVTTPHKTPTIRPLASHHENYTS